MKTCKAKCRVLPDIKIIMDSPNVAINVLTVLLQVHHLQVHTRALNPLLCCVEPSWDVEKFDLIKTIMCRPSDVRVPGRALILFRFSQQNLKIRKSSLRNANTAKARNRLKNVNSAGNFFALFCSHSYCSYFGISP